MPKKPKRKAKGPPKRKKVRYCAQVARFVIETAYLAFDTTDTDYDRARRCVLKLAKELPEEAWDATDYDEAPHISAIVREGELEEPVEFPGMFESVSHRYALLCADVETGEGDVILQPWLIIDPTNLLTSDIVSDWIGELEKLGVHQMSERVDQLLAGAPVTAEDRKMLEHLKRGKKSKPKSSNVVPFKRPKPAGDDDNGPDAA